MTKRYRLTKLAGLMTPWYRDCDNWNDIESFLMKLDGSDWNSKWTAGSLGNWQRVEEGEVTHTVEILDRDTTFESVRVSLHWLDILDALKSGELVTVPAEGSWKVKDGKVSDVKK